MANQDVVVVIDANSAKVVQAWQAFRNSIETTEAALGQMSNTQKQAANEAARAEAAAAQARQRGLQLLKSLETADEAYARREREIIDLLAQGGITSRESRQALQRLNDERERGSEATQRQARQEKELASLQQRVLASIQTPQQKYNQQLAELNRLRGANKLNEQQYAAAVRKSRNELEASNKANGGFFDSVMGKASSVAAGYLSVAGAVQGVRSALGFVIDANREFITQAEEVAEKYDKIFRQFRIQAGLRGLQGEKAQSQITAIAEEAGINTEIAGSAATALVSSGVSVQDATGGGLRGLLAILNAQGLQESDPTQYAEAIAQYLNSQGMAVNDQNVRDVGVRLQSAAMKETKFKLTDLPQLAQIGAGLKGRLTTEEQFAAISTLGDTLGAPIAATQMRDIFKNLEVAGGKKDATEWLKKMGLKPKDVDFQGESFSTVMKTMQAGLKRLSPEDQNIALNKIVEGTNIGTFRLMMDEMPRILQRSGQLNDVAGFESDVKEGSSGLNRALVRQQIRRERLQLERDNTGKLISGEIAGQSLESGETPALTDFRTETFRRLQYLTGSNEAGIVGQQVAVGLAQDKLSLRSQTEAAGIGLLTGNQLIGGLITTVKTAIASAESGGQAASDAQQRVSERMASSIEQTNRLLTEQNRLLNGGNNKPNVAPPKPVAATQRQSGRP